MAYHADFADAKEIYPVDRLTLIQACDYLNEHDPENEYHIDSTWFDYGAKLWYVTILGHEKVDKDNHNFDWQALYPVTQKALMTAITSEDVNAIMDKQMERDRQFKEKLNKQQENW